MNEIITALIEALKTADKEKREDVVAAIAAFQETYHRSFAGLMRNQPFAAKLLTAIDENI